MPGLPNAESQIAIPLLIRDDLIGVFSIESPVPRSFGEHERDLVSIVANQIASAIHNARLYEERDSPLRRCRRPTRRSRLGSRSEPRRSNANCASRRRSSTKRAAAWRGPCSAAAPPSAACAMRSHVRPDRIEPLLLTGPAGSGKEAVARAVHDASGRRARSSLSAAPRSTRSIDTPARR